MSVVLSPQFVQLVQLSHHFLVMKLSPLTHSFHGKRVELPERDPLDILGGAQVTVSDSSTEVVHLDTVPCRQEHVVVYPEDGESVPEEYLVSFVQEGVPEREDHVDVRVVDVEGEEPIECDKR